MSPIEDIDVLIFLDKKPSSNVSGSFEPELSTAIRTYGAQDGRSKRESDLDAPTRPSVELRVLLKWAQTDNKIQTPCQGRVT